MIDLSALDRFFVVVIMMIPMWRYVYAPLFVWKNPEIKVRTLVKYLFVGEGKLDKELRTENYLFWAAQNFSINGGIIILVFVILIGSGQIPVDQVLKEFGIERECHILKNC